jgi:tRNA threonylcarbamoyladenosine biosynthesis protein TsaB
VSLILNIETATKVCSVALGADGQLLGCRETANGKSHATHLTIMIEELLAQCGRQLADIDAFAVSKGPGSYTGLRIGTSTAKGLCYALDKPFIAIDTLQSMANAILGSTEKPPLLCPMLDARRMEVYCAMYDGELQEKVPVSAVIVDQDTFSDILGEQDVLFFGDGAAKCQAVLGVNSAATFNLDYQLSASSMVSLSEASYATGNFEDVAYFEPYYLKDFVAGTPKKLI